MRNLLLAMVATMVLAACQTTGEGPIVLSQGIADYYAEYLERDTAHKALAVTEDGLGAGTGACPDATACRGNAATVALNSCEKVRARHHLKPCKVFAIGNGIIWHGEVTIPDPNTEKAAI